MSPKLIIGFCELLQPASDLSGSHADFLYATDVSGFPIDQVPGAFIQASGVLVPVGFYHRQSDHKVRDVIGQSVGIESIGEPKPALGPFGQVLNLAFELPSLTGGQQADHGFPQLLLGQMRMIADEGASFAIAPTQTRESLHPDTTDEFDDLLGQFGNIPFLHSGALPWVAGRRRSDTLRWLVLDIGL